MTQGGWRALALSLGTATALAAHSATALGVTPAPTPLPRIPAAEVEPNGNVATSSPISPGERVRAPLQSSGDVDYYRFSASTGQRVFAAVVNLGSAGTSTDSDLVLIDSDGTTVIEADNDNGSFAGKSSSIAGATIPATGTYYLRVADLGSGEPTTELPYDLYLALRSGAPTAESEPNDSSAGQPADDLFVSGTRSPAADKDFFPIGLQAGDTIFLSLDLDPERDGTSFDGRLGFGPSGDADNQIMVVNDVGASEAPASTIPSEAFAMTVSRDGTYYAYVDSTSPENAGPAATYQLSATVVPAEEPTCRTYPSYLTGSFFDGGGLGYGIEAEDSMRIGRAAVALDLSQTLMADLDVSLRDPRGREIPLFTDIGSTGTGGQAHLEALIDDYAALPPAYPVARPLSLQPDGRLDWLSGKEAAGNWYLWVGDDNPNGSEGSVASAALVLCAQAGEGVAKEIFRADFENGEEGFAHDGVQDEWQHGAPATPEVLSSPPVAGLDECAEGSGCFKTDLDGTYDPSSSQNLLSPPVSLAEVGGPVEVSWEQWFQLESASYDHAVVTIEEAGGGDPRTLFEWAGPTMASFLGNPVVNGNTPSVSGWGLRRADISEYAGRTVQLRFHLDSDPIANFAGLAVDDVRVFVPGNPPDKAGPATVTLTPPPGERPSPPRSPLSGLRIKPPSFRPAPSGPSVRRPGKGPGGATISYYATSRSNSTVTISRLLPGRKVGGQCRSASSPKGPGPRCVRQVTVGGFRAFNESSSARFGFSGRVNGRVLAPGRYRLEVVAQAPGMMESSAASTGFRILP